MNPILRSHARRTLKRFGWYRKQALQSITVESARACNLRCIQCANHAQAAEISEGGQGNSKGLMSIETFSRILPILDRCDTLSFDNHGEPLLNPALESFIRLAKNRAPHLHTTFTSNFMMMTADRARSLLQAGLDSIQVSINGTTKETYEKIMRGACFETLLENLAAFARVRRTGFNTLTLFSACMTTMRSNLEELVRLPSILAPYSVELIRVNTLLPFNQEAQVEAIYDDPEWNSHREHLHAETLAEAKKFGISAYFPYVVPRQRKCAYPLRNLAINASGEVSSCWMLDISPGYHYLLPRGDSSPSLCESWERTRSGYGCDLELEKIFRVAQGV